MITEEKTSNKKRLFKILIALILIICVIILAQFAWAKYIAQINGQATAQIAQFNFIVNNKSSQEIGDIVFAVTRTDTNTKVAREVVAPGTYGVIPIDIKATGTETFLEYTINISTTNKPENLKFYYDEELTQEITLDVLDEDKGLYTYTRKGFLTFLK